ncbi:MAG: hypothetical protein SAJ37_15495, partial [Oscillatoria sp. PMC 1068.18]|nr:hypothetical protein [Oscillatoria sp. PMC 1068.18]
FEQIKHLSIYPIDLPTYYAQGEKQPLNKLLNDLVQETQEFLQLLEPEEFIKILRNFSIQNQKRLDVSHISNFNVPYIQDDPSTLEQIAVYYLVTQISNTINPIKNIFLASPEDNPLLKQFPELKSNIDKDNLLIIDDSCILHDYGIEYKDKIIQYHPWIRSRFFTKSHHTFLNKFIACYQQTNSSNKFRIAIDYNAKLKTKEECYDIQKFDTWYGALFSKEKLDDPLMTGYTCISNELESEAEYKIVRTDFFWSHSAGIKTFELEELSDVSEVRESYYLNQYLHSERNTNQKIFRHIDGAMKVYLGDKYQERIDSKLPHKNSYKKIKLWRIDVKEDCNGDIALDDWLELITYFFKYNKGVVRYFNSNKD